MSKRTIKCKMQPTPAMAKQLEKTCQAFADACNEALAIAIRDGISNNVKLHHACYNELRKNHGLSANLAVRAIRRVSAAMTRAKRQGGLPRAFRPTSVDYDARIFAFRESDETVSLTVIGARIHVPLLLGEYQRGALHGKQPTAAVLTRSHNQYSLHIVIVEADNLPPGSGIMGVDCGIRNHSRDPSWDAARGTIQAAIQRETSGNPRQLAK